MPHAQILECFQPIISCHQRSEVVWSDSTSSFLYVMRWRPLVAAVIRTGAKQEVRWRSIKSYNVHIRRRSKAQVTANLLRDRWRQKIRQCFQIFWDGFSKSLMVLKSYRGPTAWDLRRERSFRSDESFIK